MTLRRAATACRTGTLLAGAFALAYPAARADAACTACGVLVGAASVPFGTYDPGAVSTTTTGTIPLTPSGVPGGTIPVVVTISAGSGTYATRTMRLGASVLNYNLLIAPGGAVLGDGTAGTQTVATTLSTTLVPVTTNVPVYGVVAAHQLAPAGAYSDTITVTIAF